MGVARVDSVESILNRCVFTHPQFGAPWSENRLTSADGSTAYAYVQPATESHRPAFLFEVPFVQASLEAGKNGHEAPNRSA